ncbi:L domain-like protein [Anaeromyces robustus]|uniref:L domain-like protein n=1 Tax=Anaeromyces robustus TaxID=1754192 RepID=A0A1Y1WCU3_9FUNG|nr:L domain-like protein [Anaeromyces robustus]|eukprot:ORX71046.1 L domain-like protein [Anaeromyces robustus]
MNNGIIQINKIINNSNLERISNNTKIKEIGTLDLRNNSFTEFPKELYNSERINNIIFDNNKMSGELKLLDSLVSFSGNNNFFNSIIHNNSSITELYLSNNDFNDISFDNITNLKKLKKLDLSGNKKITKIPSSIKEIFSLEELNLSNTNITTISKYIYNMTFLNNLDISNNPQLKTKIINFYKPVKCNFENTNILCYEPGSCENIDSNKYKPCTEKEIEEIKSIYIGGEYMDYNSEKSFEFSKSIIIIIIFISIILLIISIKFAQSRYKKRKFEKTRNRVIESKRKAHENDNQNLKYTENNINSEINITDNPSDIPLNELVPSNEPYIPMAEPIYETNDNKSKEKAYHDEKFIVNSPSIPTAELVRNYDNNDIYIRNTNVNNNNDILPRYSELDEHDDVEPVNDKISYELLLNSNNTR